MKLWERIKTFKFNFNTSDSCHDCTEAAEMERALRMQLMSEQTAYIKLKRAVILFVFVAGIIYVFKMVYTSK